jgi:3'-phosphoadenosine 5'-phosphosulfate sulfotransferase (PAPS reductase)/FAD synthetase
MTPAAAFAMERLSHLARLFDHARLRARCDSLALSEILDQAAMLLDEIAPAVASCKGGEDEAIVVQFACEARDQHIEMVRAIGLEIERITKELDRLARSSQANARYGAASARPKLRLIERSA